MAHAVKVANDIFDNPLFKQIKIHLFIISKRTGEMVATVDICYKSKRQVGEYLIQITYDMILFSE